MTRTSLRHADSAANETSADNTRIRNTPVASNLRAALALITVRKPNEYARIHGTRLTQATAGTRPAFRVKYSTTALATPSETDSIQTAVG